MIPEFWAVQEILENTVTGNLDGRQAPLRRAPVAIRDSRKSSSGTTRAEASNRLPCHETLCRHSLGRLLGVASRNCLHDRAAGHQRCNAPASAALGFEIFGLKNKHLCRQRCNNNLRLVVTMCGLVKFNHIELVYFLIGDNGGVRWPRRNRTARVRAIL